MRISVTSSRCFGSASIHWFSRSKSLKSSVAFRSSVYCFTFCAVCAYQPSSPLAMPAMRWRSVGCTVPVTFAAGAAVLFAFSHSGCAVLLRVPVPLSVTMPLLPGYACVLPVSCGTASCSLWPLSAPVICASTRAPRPVPVFCLAAAAGLAAFCPLLFASQLSRAFAMRSGVHLSVVFAVPAAVPVLAVRFVVRLLFFASQLSLSFFSLSGVHLLITAGLLYRSASRIFIMDDSVLSVMPSAESLPAISSRL